jgi:ketosteroid isomerase-like protein
MTNRNIAAWVSGVHGFLSAENPMSRENYRAVVRSLMELEIENSFMLLDLLDDDVEFMAMTDKGETPLIHGLNLKENIRKRIRLMQEHMEDEPYIDPDYIEKMAGRPMS